MQEDTPAQKVVLCILLAFLGIALDFAMTPLFAEVAYVIEAEESRRPGVWGRGVYALAYGLFNVAFAGGMLVGPLLGGAVVQGIGWGRVGWALAILSAAGAGVSALWVGGWIGDFWTLKGRRAGEGDEEGEADLGDRGGERGERGRENGGVEEARQESGVAVLRRPGPDEE